MLNSEGELEIPESTRTHFRRSLEKEFRDAIDFEDLHGNNLIFAIPRNLSRLDLAKQVIEKVTLLRLALAIIYCS